MKIITILISIIGFQYMTFAQKHISRQPLKADNKKIGYIATPTDSQAKFTPSTQAKDIVITDLPNIELALTSVNIQLENFGSFTFKASPSLMIPYNCEVFIEDKLSGKLFNLKSADVYSFEVIQHVENRFVLHLLDKTNPGMLVSSGVIRDSKSHD